MGTPDGFRPARLTIGVISAGRVGTALGLALERADLTRSEIDVVQIYDAFTSNVLISLEELGFCERGESGAFVQGGRIAPGGEFPLNTSGGGLSFNHGGMFGMPLMIESVRQLRGDCGERQVPGARNCLVQAGGLVMSAYMVMVLGKPA